LYDCTSRSGAPTSIVPVANASVYLDSIAASAVGSSFSMA
jgi:hypothetical protein